MTSARPTLTLCVASRDGASRLPQLLAEAQRYADEIVVGVDVASTDATLDVATAGADRVYRFRHDGALGARYAAGIERARCDWVLFLDDDEGMDAAFPQLRDELLTVPGTVAWSFPKRWITGLAPPRYLHASPWFPDPQTRLIVADPARIWKPQGLHTGLSVIGPRHHETRTSILHYELVDRDGRERDAKMSTYRARGQDEANEAFYFPAEDVHRREVTPAPLRGTCPAVARRRRAVVDDGLDDLTQRPHLPPWAAELSVEHAETARAASTLVATVEARNTGTLHWAPSASGEWPDLNLSYRIRGPEGHLAPDRAPRARLGRDVPPGSSCTLHALVHVPDVPGTYVLEWQMLSEMHHWFGDLGSPPARVVLRVTR